MSNIVLNLDGNVQRNAVNVLDDMKIRNIVLNLSSDHVSHVFLMCITIR